MVRIASHKGDDMKNDRQHERREEKWNPNFVAEFRAGQAGSVFFHPADEESLRVFKMNIKNPKTRAFKFDLGAFTEVAGQAPMGSFNGGSPVAILGVEDLRKALKPDEELWTGFPEDGQEEGCGLCGNEYQPHERSTFERDNGKISFTGGDFAIVRKDVLQEFAAELNKVFAESSEKYKADLAVWKPAEGSGRFLDLSATIKPEPPVDPTEVINRIVSSVEKTMAELFPKGSKAPELAVALPLGYKCGCQGRMRNACHATFVARKSVLDALAFADMRIGAAADRNQTADILENLGALRSPQHTVGAGPSDGRRFDNRRNFRGGHNRDQREPKPHRDWHGADLEVDTADNLDKFGYTSPSDALAAANNGELIRQGIAHPGSIKYIKLALERASKGRTVVGEAHRSVPDQSQKFESGADRPSKAHGSKKRELTAPSKSERKSGRSGKSGKSGESISFSQLRD